MIISIASGKGGTGKTTVATNLTASLGTDLTLLDCDVEEPNAHLFLNPEIKGREIVNSPVPEVDESRCTYCRKCMDICRFGAIAVMGKKVITFPELCHSCGGCTQVCPEKAIRETDRAIAKVETGTLSLLPRITHSPEAGFARGLLDIGQVMAPPVIRQVRTHANKQGLTIIDAPPGTSCPVISAMKGADVVVLVTEPTPFGLHDLVLAVEAVKLLGIPHGLVINRAGMGNDDVRAYAEAENLPQAADNAWRSAGSTPCQSTPAVIPSTPSTAKAAASVWIYARNRPLTSPGRPAASGFSPIPDSGIWCTPAWVLPKKIQAGLLPLSVKRQENGWRQRMQLSC
jgi:MinD superfamily P-loop ATPase